MIGGGWIHCRTARELETASSPAKNALGKKAEVKPPRKDGLKLHPFRKGRGKFGPDM